MVPSALLSNAAWGAATSLGLAAVACVLVAAGPAGAVTRARQPTQHANRTDQCPDANLTATTPDRPLFAGAVACLLNVQRRAHRLLAFSRSRQLDRSASFHCADMLSHHYYAHDDPGRPSLLQRIAWTGYFAHAAHGFYAENLGEGVQATTTPQIMVDAWMHSSEHRATILDPRLRDVGVGIALAPPDPAFYAQDPAVVITTDFGARTGSR